MHSYVSQLLRASVCLFAFPFGIVAALFHSLCILILDILPFCIAISFFTIVVVPITTVAATFAAAYVFAQHGIRLMRYLFCCLVEVFTVACDRFAGLMETFSTPDPRPDPLIVNLEFLWHVANLGVRGLLSLALIDGNYSSTDTNCPKHDTTRDGRKFNLHISNIHIPNTETIYYPLTPPATVSSPSSVVSLQLFDETCDIDTATQAARLAEYLPTFSEEQLASVDRYVQDLINTGSKS